MMQNSIKPQKMSTFSNTECRWVYKKVRDNFEAWQLQNTWHMAMFTPPAGSYFISFMLFAQPKRTNSIKSIYYKMGKTFRLSVSLRENTSPPLNPELIRKIFNLQKKPSAYCSVHNGLQKQISERKLLEAVNDWWSLTLWCKIKTESCPACMNV